MNTVKPLGERMKKKVWGIVGDKSFEKRLKDEANFDAGINIVPPGGEQGKTFPVTVDRIDVDQLYGKRQFGVKIKIFDTPTEDNLLATVSGGIDFGTPGRNGVVGNLEEI